MLLGKTATVILLLKFLQIVLDLRNGTGRNLDGLRCRILESDKKKPPWPSPAFAPIDGGGNVYIVTKPREPGNFYNVPCVENLLVNWKTSKIFVQKKACSPSLRHIQVSPWSNSFQIGALFVFFIFRGRG